MIEVEIRGPLSEKDFERLTKIFAKEGELMEKNKREMYLLRGGYPGYDIDPTKRDTDIRIKNTDGECEIVVKHKLSDGNSARKEINLKLADNNLDKAKEIVKAFGCNKGLKMIRERNVYRLNGIEWTLGNCPPKNIKYYEAEMEASNQEEISEIKNKLFIEAKKLKLKTLESDEQMREFIHWLDKEVNEEMEF